MNTFELAGCILFAWGNFALLTKGVLVMKSIRKVMVYANNHDCQCYISGIFAGEPTIDEAIAFINYVQFDPKYPDLAANDNEGEEFIKCGEGYEWRDDTDGMFYIVPVATDHPHMITFRGNNTPDDL